jgi:hypothetical protein
MNWNIGLNSILNPISTSLAGFPPLILQFSNGGSIKTIVISSPLILGLEAKLAFIAL